MKGLKVEKGLIIIEDLIPSIKSKKRATSGYKIGTFCKYKRYEIINKSRNCRVSKVPQSFH